jgi:hypothetical protein
VPGNLSGLQPNVIQEDSRKASAQANSIQDSIQTSPYTQYKSNENHTSFILVRICQSSPLRKIFLKKERASRVNQMKMASVSKKQQKVIAC